MLPLAFIMYGGLAALMENLFIDEEDETVQEDIIVRKASVSSTQE
jgi:hypothetical protein